MKKNINLALISTALFVNLTFAQTAPSLSGQRNCEKPVYPSESSTLGEEGTVLLRFLIGTDGNVIESSVENSSGFKRLDESAKEAISKCHFNPATKDGLPVQGAARMKFTFRLEDAKPIQVTKQETHIAKHESSKGLNGLFRCKLIEMQETSSGRKTAMDTPAIIKIVGNNGTMEYAKYTYTLDYLNSTNEEFIYAINDTRNAFLKNIKIYVNKIDSKPTHFSLFTNKYLFTGRCLVR